MQCMLLFIVGETIRWTRLISIIFYEKGTIWKKLQHVCNNVIHRNEVKQNNYVLSYIASISVIIIIIYLLGPRQYFWRQQRSKRTIEIQLGVPLVRALGNGDLMLQGDTAISLEVDCIRGIAANIHCRG